MRSYLTARVPSPLAVRPALAVLLPLVVLLPVVSSANPAPFGLQIGAATIDDVRQNYSAMRTGINRYSGGEMYELEVSRIAMEGLREATVIFSRDGTLLAVLTTLDKSRFDFLFAGLRSKYQLVSQDIPFVGSKRATFMDGNTVIELDAPHLSFQMTMNYIDEDLLRLFEYESTAERERQEASEIDQL